jgi:hypothetical protein
VLQAEQVASEAAEHLHVLAEPQGPVAKSSSTAARRQALEDVLKVCSCDLSRSSAPVWKSAPCFHRRGAVASPSRVATCHLMGPLRGLKNQKPERSWSGCQASHCQGLCNAGHSEGPLFAEARGAAAAAPGRGAAAARPAPWPSGLLRQPARPAAQLPALPASHGPATGPHPSPMHAVQEVTLCGRQIMTRTAAPAFVSYMHAGAHAKHLGCICGLRDGVCFLSLGVDAMFCSHICCGRPPLLLAPVRTCRRCHEKREGLNREPASVKPCRCCSRHYQAACVASPATMCRCMHQRVPRAPPWTHTWPGSFRPPPRCPLGCWSVSHPLSSPYIPLYFTAFTVCSGIEHHIHGSRLSLMPMYFAGHTFLVLVFRQV